MQSLFVQVHLSERNGCHCLSLKTERKAFMIVFDTQKSRKDKANMQYPDFSYIPMQMKAFLSTHPGMRWKHIAERAGLDASSISKYKNGQCCAMQKASVIRLAVALELDWEHVQAFVHAAGYAFPHDEIDCAVREIFMKHQGRSIRYHEFLYAAEENPIFDTFLDEWFG